MATLTRTRPSFQVVEDPPVAEHHRPLHLDIPTPFPNLSRSSEHQRQDPRSETEQGENGHITISSIGEARTAEMTEGMDVDGEAVEVPRAEEEEDTASSVSP